MRRGCMILPHIDRDARNALQREIGGYEQKKGIRTDEQKETIYGQKTSCTIL